MGSNLPERDIRPASASTFAHRSTSNYDEDPRIAVSDAVSRSLPPSASRKTGVVCTHEAFEAVIPADQPSCAAFSPVDLREAGRIPDR